MSRVPEGRWKAPGGPSQKASRKAAKLCSQNRETEEPPRRVGVRFGVSGGSRCGGLRASQRGFPSNILSTRPLLGIYHLSSLGWGPTNIPCKGYGACEYTTLRLVAQRRQRKPAVKSIASPSWRGWATCAPFPSTTPARPARGGVVLLQRLQVILQLILHCGYRLLGGFCLHL